MERNRSNLFLKRKINELAGMLKEKKKGTLASLEKIKARFCLQEGVNPRTAEQYMETLVSSGLVTVLHGSSVWKYNEDQEWDQFHVPIKFGNERR